MLLDATWGWLDADNLLDERIRMSSRCLLSRFCRKLLMKEWAAVFDCDMDSSKISSFSLTFENVRLSFRSTTWLSSQHEYFLRSPRPTRIGPDYTIIKIYFVKSSFWSSNFKPIGHVFSFVLTDLLLYFRRWQADHLWLFYPWRPSVR